MPLIVGCVGVRNTGLVAPTGPASNYLAVYVPQGCRVRAVSARNLSTLGQRIKLFLSRSSASLPSALPDAALFANLIQGSDEGDVVWNGEMPIRNGFNYLVAEYHNAVAGDLLEISAVVEK